MLPQLPKLSKAMTLLTAPAHLCTAGTLKEVAVAGVRGTDAAAAALIRAASRNNSLQLLDVRGVALGPEVRVFDKTKVVAIMMLMMIRLIRAASRTNSLQLLDVRGVALGPEVCAIISLSCYLE